MENEHGHVKTRQRKQLNQQDPSILKGKSSVTTRLWPVLPACVRSDSGLHWIPVSSPSSESRHLARESGFITGIYRVYTARLRVPVPGIRVRPGSLESARALSSKRVTVADRDGCSRLGVEPTQSPASGPGGVSRCLGMACLGVRAGLRLASVLVDVARASQRADSGLFSDRPS